LVKLLPQREKDDIHERSKHKTLLGKKKIEEGLMERKRERHVREKREGRGKSFLNLERERDEDNEIFLVQNQINILST
jgi:hypothetical protein